MWAILEQLRDHATTIVGLVTALTLMYSWFRKPMKQLRIPLIIAPKPSTSSPLTKISRKSAVQAHCLHTK